MKRKEFLKKIGYEVPDNSKIRLFIDSDAKNEADDQYAVMHFLLSPTIDIAGIGAAHFEKKDKSLLSAKKSYDEIKKILKLSGIEDVNCYLGAQTPINNLKYMTNDASLKIIEEAKKGHIYVATLGALTNLAIALLIDPSIAENITVIMNGGGPYPLGRSEFNFMQDIEAARIVLNSNAEIWQIPQNVYASLEVSLAQLREKVYPCGEIGQYLFEQLVECNLKEFNPNFMLRTGENWTLGDNATIAVLLMNRFRNNFEMIDAPNLNDDGTYKKANNSKKIRVYNFIDVELTLNDLFSKLKLLYGE